MYREVSQVFSRLHITLVIIGHTSHSTDSFEPFRIMHHRCRLALYVRVCAVLRHVSTGAPTWPSKYTVFGAVIIDRFALHYILLENLSNAFSMLNLCCCFAGGKVSVCLESPSSCRSGTCKTERVACPLQDISHDQSLLFSDIEAHLEKQSELLAGRVCTR